MDKPDKFRGVLRSMDSFEALRSALAYLRSISVVFECAKPGGGLAAIGEKIQATAPEQLTERDLRRLSSYYAAAAISTHIALMYTAVCFYKALVEVNPALRHETLDKALEIATCNGLLDSMREVRNAVFHVRPGTRSEALVTDVLKRVDENKLRWNTIEALLFDATQQVFQSPEDLYQEKEEVLMEGYRSALAYYEEHLAEST